MPLYGQAGAAASDALMQVLAEQVRQQLAQEEMRQRKMRLDEDARQFDAQHALNQQQFQAGERVRQQQMDRQGRQDRQEENATGVRRMIGDFLIQRGAPPNRGERTTLEGMALQEGINLPELERPADELAAEQAAKDAHDLRLYEQKEQIGAKYRPRPQGPAPETFRLVSPTGEQRVVQGVNAANQLLAQGWKQYDAAAIRQTQNALPPDQTNQVRTDILSAAKALKSHPGRGAYTGTRFNPSHGFGWYDDPIGGTSAAGAKVLHDNLTALLALPNLEKLRGPLSDKDIEFIKAASSKLQATAPDADFESELDAIIQKLESVELPPRPGGPTRLRFDAKGNPIP